MTAPNTLKPVDAHVHLVGNGRRGSGCWMRVGGLWHRPLAAVMLHFLGMTGSRRLDAEDFDERYVAHILHLVRTSSMGHAVLLAHDEVYDEHGRKMEGRGSVYVPNDYLLRLCREHPEFLPAVSIHPSRPDALDELEKCIESGAVMLKLLPNCHNVDCSDRRLKKFWRRMAEARLPLLAHKGGEHTIPVINAAYADPRRLRVPLECGVTVIAAHCATKSGLGDPDYFPAFVSMLREFPNLYGDTSALISLNRCGRLRECLGPELRDRVVHGSDVPVPILGHRLWLRGDLPTWAFRKWQQHRNPLERDYQMKVAMGFPPEHFTRIHSILRPRATPVPAAPR